MKRMRKRKWCGGWNGGGGGERKYGEKNYREKGF